MPKKNGQKKDIAQDFTLSHFADAPKAVTRVKKVAPVSSVDPDILWDDIPENELDITHETDDEGKKCLVFKRKKNKPKFLEENIINRPGLEYPEIIWYLISQFIKPEVIGTFAQINKATYLITKRESFWRNLYKRHCQNSSKLPERLRIENSYKLYGLQQRVIRALHHTYEDFIRKIAQQAVYDSKPHELVKRQCVNVWYCKGSGYWSVFFKFKKLCPFKRSKVQLDFLEELERIDANPEQDVQVLQVNCENFYEVPPLMGLTLSSVSVGLSKGFCHHRLHLGFNNAPYAISKNMTPEHLVTIDNVINMLVIDWWHPKFPHFDNKLPICSTDDEAKPILKIDFFNSDDGDIL